MDDAAAMASRAAAQEAQLDPVSLDEVAAEIARCEALLTADILSVRHRTATFEATERAEEQRRTTTTTAAAAAAAEWGQDTAAAAAERDEAAQQQELIDRIMAAHQQETAELAQQPGRAWEKVLERGAAAAALTRARPTTASAQKAKAPAPASSRRRRPNSAPRTQPRLPGESAPDRRYRPSRQELERQAREKLDRDCTFKPNVRRTGARKSPADSQTRQERVDSLAKSKLNLWRKREQQRIEIAEKEAQQCTFEPKVAATKAAAKAATAAEAKGGSVTDRLYHEADGRIANRQRQKREKEAAELTRLQFAPTLNSTSTASVETGSSEPRLHERISELQRAKSEKMARLRNEAQAANADLTFKPKVPDATTRIVEGRKSAAGSGKRTAQQELADKARKARLARAAEVKKKEKDALSFKPAIPNSSADIAASNPAFKGEKGGDFLKRSQMFELRRAEQAAEAAEEQAVEQAVTETFQPAIPSRSSQLVKSQEGRKGETYLDKMVRLAYGDAQHRDEVAALASAEFYGQFTYAPQVGRQPSGKRGAGPPSSIDALVSDERAEAARGRAAEEAEAVWQKSHTFQPTLDAVSKRLAELSQPSRAVRYSEPDNLLSAIEAERQRKQRRIEQSRNSLEYDTLKGCTFNPRTNENVPDKTTEGGAADKTTDAAGGEAGKSLRRKSKVEVKPDVARRRRSSAPVVVRGLGRHLELQEAAKRKEKMKEQRAEEVFHVAKSALEGRAGLYTVPKPFQLSTEQRSKDRARHTEDDIHRRMGGGDFEDEQQWGRPQTNVRAEQSLLERVMNDSETTAQAAH